MLKTGVGQKSCSDRTTTEEHPRPVSPNDQPSENASSRQTTNRHIVRNKDDFTDRYHGPCTLLALCNEFCSEALPRIGSQSSATAKDEDLQGKGQDGPSKTQEAKDLLARMCFEAGIEESFDPPSDHTPIRLPPKQFLLMVQTQFFQQSNHATDIFVQSRFRSNVERIYSRPFTSADETWAICFNTVILLVLGSENSTQGDDPLIGSQFALPFLSTVRTALGNPRVLMAPKLSNVQALALLVSTRYYL